MERKRNLSGIVIGVILVLVGILSLFGQIFRFLNMDNLWPLFIVGAGVVFFVIMLLGDKSWGGLAVPGSILVVIGVILFIMNRTNSYEDWSYYWALIVCAAGVGEWINGYWSERPDQRKSGLSTLRTGLILFAVFGVIMEFIFSLSGVSRSGNFLLWAVLLTLIGLYLLVTHLLQIGRPGSEKVDLFWPVLMIGVGIFACLSYLGWLPSGNLERMLNLWPLLLIAAGVGIIFRSRSPWVGLTLSLLIVTGVFVVGFAGAQLGLPSAFSWFPDIGSLQFGDVARETIFGSGKAVSVDLPISGVDRVEIGIPADLEIRQGQSELLSLTVDDNILPVLLTEVVGGELNIRYKPQVNVRNITPLKIILTVKDLKALTLSSTGSAKVGTLTTGDFNLSLSSTCSVDLQQIQADAITIRISSSGNVTIRGNANSLDLRLSSSGDFQGADLKVQTADVNVSSSGNVTVWVIESLTANLSSSGNVSYYGSPTVSKNTSSSGQLVDKGVK